MHIKLLSPNRWLIFFSVISLLGCKKEEYAEPAFYFWRTCANLTKLEKQTLTDHSVHFLYVKFFDVDVPNGNNGPQPIGVIDSLELIPTNIEVIPVIFITNRTFLNFKKNDISILAEQMVGKINSIKPKYKQLQIDCDWTEKTKSNYFYLLSQLRKTLSSSVKLSCTIRLHQIKYSKKTGVPPVDGGMLMFYNMGNIHTLDGLSSIYDAITAEKYISYLRNYKLHLDVAMPIFRWYVHYRNGQVIGLITKKNLPETANTTYFSKEKNSSIFKVKQTQLINAIFYKEGDLLKYEALTNSELMDAAKQLKDNLTLEDRRIVLYDLDEINIKYYDKKTIQTIFTSFN